MDVPECRAVRRPAFKGDSPSDNDGENGPDSIPNYEQADKEDDEMRDASPLSHSTSKALSTSMNLGSKRPKDSAFRQQRLPAWQPILTPYNVIPTLFVLALVFIPLGAVFLIVSNQVQEYVFDYSSCLKSAPLDKFAPAPSGLGSEPFQWRRLNSLPSYALESSPDFSQTYTDAGSLCEIRFQVTKKIDGPVYQYYRLSNFYQNQRLYVKSVDWGQLKGDAKSASQLGECEPLVGPSETPDLVYYPCGLIANSIFNDTLGGLVQTDASGRSTGRAYQFLPKDISWASDQAKYGPSKYSTSQIRPPPFWVKNRRLVNPDGTYKKVPNFENDERFQNWMKVAGLPTFRKTYGKLNQDLPAGTYTILVASTYEVESYGAKKAVVISNTSWMGGKNSFLGWAYIIAGSVFLLLAIAFLARHIVAPRRLGDTSYLSWNRPDQGSD